MAAIEGVSIPSDRKELEKLLVCPDDCESLNDYLQCFDLPVSIMQTKAVEGVTTMSQYPLQAFLSDGVPVCINTDNMTVSNTTVQNEFQKLYDAGILTIEQAKTMVRTAIKHTFLSEIEKEELLQLAERRMNCSSTTKFAGTSR